MEACEAYNISVRCAITKQAMLTNLANAVALSKTDNAPMDESMNRHSNLEGHY